jgi:hypothetical protein
LGGTFCRVYLLVDPQRDKRTHLRGTPSDDRSVQTLNKRPGLHDKAAFAYLYKRKSAVHAILTLVAGKTFDNCANLLYHLTANTERPFEWI